MTRSIDNIVKIEQNFNQTTINPQEMGRIDCKF